MLRQSGHQETAIDLLRPAQRQHPDDFWFNLHLAEVPQ
jgi:hypothetical protein